MDHDGLYLWVNVDQKPLKSKACASAVNSFVQPKRKAHRKDQLKKLQASIQAKHLPWRLLESGSVLSLNHDTVVPRTDPTHNNKKLNTLRAIASRGQLSQPDSIARQQVCIFPSKDQLDPFLPLADTLTFRDRNFLHYYLTMIPESVFGTSKSAEDCLVRDQTAVFVQMNDTWLHWVLLLAEIHRLGPAAAEISSTVLARRAKLYRRMYEMVANAKTRYSDITITALGFAAWAEARSNSIEIAQHHLLGVKYLVQGRGGLAELPLVIGSPCPYPFIWLGIGAGAFPDIRSLEFAIDLFVCLMKSMGNLQQKYRQAVIGIDARDFGANESCLQRYVGARKKAFGSLSALWPFLQVPFFDPTNRVQMRSHIALLWMLNKALWELRRDPAESSGFLEELDRRVTASDETAQSLKKAVTGHLDDVEIQRLGLDKREPTIKASAVVHIYANSSTMVKWPPARDCAPEIRGPRVLRWYESTTIKAGDEAVPPVVRLVENADVVELVQFLSAQSRRKVLEQLSAWLVSDVAESSEYTTPSSEELEKIADEMRCAWVKAQEGVDWRKPES